MHQGPKNISLHKEIILEAPKPSGDNCVNVTQNFPEWFLSALRVSYVFRISNKEQRLNMG